MTIKLNEYLEPIDEAGKESNYPDFFRSAKEQLGMTSAELAREIGCNVRRIEEYLYGKRVKHPGLMVLGKIKHMMDEKEKNNV